ncbi:protein-tyrosine phosphatase-like protein [Gaertneriomyces semiglobifer]|nr:protein-tyrosine phosphatase-like protein [Gaertneriomyces semiglobifer]
MSTATARVETPPQHPETNIAKKAMQQEALRPDVQIVDQNTKPDQIPEAVEPAHAPVADNVDGDAQMAAAATGPVPLMLAEEERPIPEVFQNIVNFRDIGKNYNLDAKSPLLKEDWFFRSGRLDDASTKDLDLLTAKYKIKVVVDLRSETEGKMGEDLVNTFPASAINEQTSIIGMLSLPEKKKRRVRVHTKGNKSASGRVEPTDAEASSPGPNTAVEYNDVNLTYYVNFAGNKFRKNLVWNPLRFSTKLKVIGLMMVGRKPRVVELVGQEAIQPRGLLGLNYAFVDFCGSEIVQALRVMSNTNNYPLLVHCTQGKDRTGLVVALALSICNVSRDLIIKDYARTNQGLARQRDIMVEEMRKTGLDSTFSDAPPEVLEKTLSYIDTKYGGAVKYLEDLGFGSEDQARLRACLVQT